MFKQSGSPKLLYFNASSISYLVITFRVKQIESFQKKNKMFEKSSLEHEIEKYFINSA